MNLLALDIGGANLKAADGRGFARSVAFPLWQRPDDLTTAIAALLGESPPAERIAATMTGELADCFATKAEGVRHIVAALWQAAGDRPVRIYCTDGTLASPEQVVENPLPAAASNWHALASFVAAGLLEGAPGLVIDVGSTTTDLIPVDGGQPVPCGNTDTDRLRSGELVYTGVMRTPVCTILGELPYRGRSCPVAGELFATAWDAYLTLGDLPEQPQRRDTADGRRATIDAAHDRLARMVCADRESFSSDDARTAAKAIRDAQQRQIAAAWNKLAGRGAASWRRVVIGGAGEFLARRVLAQVGYAGETISLEECLGPEVSVCAPAHALAVLARERGAWS